jgi:hypothetical protein
MWLLIVGNFAVSAMLASQLSKLAVSLGAPVVPMTLLGQPANLTRVGLAMLIFCVAFGALNFVARDVKASSPK